MPRRGASLFARAALPLRRWGTLWAGSHQRLAAKSYASRSPKHHPFIAARTGVCVEYFHKTENLFSRNATASGWRGAFFGEKSVSCAEEERMSKRGEESVPLLSLPIRENSSHTLGAASPSHHTFFTFSPAFAPPINAFASVCARRYCSLSTACGHSCALLSRMASRHFSGGKFCCAPSHVR